MEKEEEREVCGGADEVVHMIVGDSACFSFWVGFTEY